MSTNLSLHHVGEVILSGLLTGLARDDLLGAVPCKLHADCSLLSIMRSANVTPPYSFDVNVPVVLGGDTLGFDGAHGVDVLCHNGHRGLPIEAKLGLDRLSCAAFTERFLKQPRMSEHSPPRCNGSMTAILNYRCIGESDLLTLRTETPATELTSSWVLVVRTKTWERWTARPILANAHVVVFEDVASAHGDSTAFDRLVLQQIGGGFHSAWEVF